jgi:copper chaperone CopZ
MKTVLAITFIAVIAIAFLVAQTESEKPNVVKLALSGLTCGSCVGKVEASLKAVEGVDNVKVDLKSSLAEVTLVSNADVTTSALILAVEEAGYTASADLATGSKEKKNDGAGCGDEDGCCSAPTKVDKSRKL